MISNWFINDILNKLLYKEYKGCWSANNIVHLPDPHTGLIANLSIKNTPGTHFIAFFRKDNKEIIYIDSLCTKMTSLPKPIKTWMKRQKAKFTPYYKTSVQADNSFFCGFFCILSLLELCYNETRTKFQRRNLKKNDIICIDRIVSLVNKRERNK